MKHVLVIANRTLCEQHLLDALRARRDEGPATYRLLVPATHPSGPWTDADCRRAAQARLEESLETLAIFGLPATGEVGDADPVAAATDAMRRHRVDEIIVSTLPTGLSRWLAGNVVRRLERLGPPVTHVVADAVPSGR
jgi:hypothetical protein